MVGIMLDIKAEKPSKAKLFLVFNNYDLISKYTNLKYGIMAGMTLYDLFERVIF